MKLLHKTQVAAVFWLPKGKTLHDDAAIPPARGIVIAKVWQQWDVKKQRLMIHCAAFFRGKIYGMHYKLPRLQDVVDLWDDWIDNLMNPETDPNHDEYEDYQAVFPAPDSKACADGCEVVLSMLPMHYPKLDAMEEQRTRRGHSMVSDPAVLR